MNSALTYLLITRLKAQFKEMVRKPARLIYLVLVIALFAVTLLGGNEAEGASRDARELPALAGAFYGLMFVILVGNGFKNGASMFTLSDVNLLFPAPIRPRAVLYYGLFRQLGASLLLGLFLLFQYGWLHSLYGIGVGALILIVVLYGVSVFLAQVVAMAAYSLTSLVSWLPLEAGAGAWAEAILSLPRPPRAQASQEAAAALKQGGYALQDAAAALLDFYRTLAPSREDRSTKG